MNTVPASARTPGALVFLRVDFCGMGGSREVSLRPASTPGAGALPAGPAATSIRSYRIFGPTPPDLALPGPRRRPSIPAMALRFRILGSGSSGNAALLSTDDTRVLVD